MDNIENVEQNEPKEVQKQPPTPDDQEPAADEQAETPEPEGKEPDATEKPEGQEEPAEPKPETDEKHRRAGGWQRKIDRLERERAMLLDQLATQRPAQQQSATPDKSKDPAAQVEEYISNLVEQRLKQREDNERQTRAQVEFQKRTQEVRKANPDFDDVVMSVDAPVSQALQQSLLTSEHGPAIMYELAKNPAELARLNALPPLDAAREIGRLEAKASVTPAPQRPKSGQKPPAPPTNVGGSSSSARNLDDMPLADYKRAYRSGRR